MTDSLLLFLSLLLPIAGMISIPFLPHPIRAKANLIFVLLIAAITSIPAVKALTGNAVDTVISKTLVFGNISLHIDSLSSWFILIINLTCINGAFYGIGYMKQYDQQRANLSMHWILFLLFQSSMIWVCIVQNGLFFLIAWEIMSIASLLLVIFEHHRHEIVKAGVNYMVQMHISVAFLSVAFIWVYSSEGSFDFSAIGNFFSHNQNVWLFLLFFAGFGIKAGFIPLHSWLPHAHPAAPSHISGVMSGVIVKMGIYGIIRIALMLKSDLMLIGESLLVLSILTGIYGILNAAVHRDFKKMLAYCTIENIGIIGIGIGLGLMGIGSGNSVMIILGFSGALLHTLNHSLFKSLLFFTAGSVYQQTHTRDMEKLGGLVHSMPQTAMFFLVGGMAIGGLPPFNGFVSEFLLYSGLLLGIKSIGITYITLMIFSLAGLALIGGISILTFTKSFGTVFLGNPRTPLHQQPREVTLGMRLPQYFILIIMLSIGLFPQFYFSVVSEIVLKVIPVASSGSILIPASLLNSISAIGKFAMLFIVFFILIYLVRKSISRKHSVATDSTWGCGYIDPHNKMQYTGKSFSKTLGKLFGFIVTEKKKYTELKAEEIFPKARKHSAHYIDFFENNIFDKVINRLIHGMGYFRFIQNGRIQMYVLYGVFFMVLIFLGTLFGFI